MAIEFKSFDQSAWPVCEKFRPMRGISLSTDWYRDNSEIFGSFVRTDVKQAFTVVQIVAVPFFSRQKGFNLLTGAVCRQEPDLSSNLACYHQLNELLIFGSFGPDVVQFIRFPVESLELLLTHPMAKQCVGAFGHRIFRREKKSLAVRRPFYGSHPFGGVRQRLPGLKVLYLQAVLAKTCKIDGVRQQAVVITYREAPDTDKLAPSPEFVRIQENFLRRFHRFSASAMDSILLTLFGARVIEILTSPGRNREVGLLDAPQHLSVKFIGQRLQVAGGSGRVGVFVFEIFRYFRVRFVAQPVIVVIDFGAVANFPVAPARRLRRRHRNGVSVRRSRQGIGNGEFWHGNLVLRDLAQAILSLPGAA